MANKILDKYQFDIPVTLDATEKEIQQLIPLEHQANILAEQIMRKSELCDSINESIKFIQRQCELINKKEL